jgi:hypothetical protein
MLESPLETGASLRGTLPPQRSVFDQQMKQGVVSGRDSAAKAGLARVCAFVHCEMIGLAQQILR